MIEHLFHSIQAALRARWDSKLPLLLSKARNFAVGGMARVRAAMSESKEAETEKVLREAYMAGYRQAYWDGVVDIIECAIEAEKTGHFGTAQETVHDGVH